MVSIEERPIRWSPGTDHQAAPPAARPSSRQRPAVDPDRVRIDPLLVWFFRALMLTPFVLMGPEIVSLIQGQPGAVENVAESTADVFGTSSMLLMMLMLTITPIQTMTGWGWHLVLRRDFGVGMFVSAAVDLILAALTTGSTFGGLFGRIGGRTFLLVGTLAVLLLIPLAITTPKRMHRWLGVYWKRLHRLVYVIWVLVLLHLLLLFGFDGIFLQALAMSAPLLVLRLPPVRRWWSAARRKRRHRILRGALAVVMVGTFVAGMRPVIAELSLKGVASFNQQPID